MKYFAYGSNLVTQRLTARVGQIRLLGTSQLGGWNLTFGKLGGDNSGKCTLIRDVSRTTYGAVYEIKKSQQLLLDAFEKGYDTIAINLPEFGKCFTYVANSNTLNTTLFPYDWYKLLVLKGAKIHNFPKSYVCYIDSFADRIDTDSDRASQNLEIFNKDL